MRRLPVIPEKEKSSKQGQDSQHQAYFHQQGLYLRVIEESIKSGKPQKQICYFKRPLQDLHIFLFYYFHGLISPYNSFSTSLKADSITLSMS